MVEVRGIMDIQALIQPVATDRPGGQDLRSREERNNPLAPLQVYYRDLVAMERASQQGQPLPTDAPKVTWREFTGKCETLLKAESKDLEVAAYLAQAWTRQHHLAGLGNGLRLMSQLLATFWEDLSPRLEREEGGATVDAGFRAKWITWISSSQDFREALGGVALGKSNNGRQLTLGAFQQMRLVVEANNRANQDEKARLVTAGAHTPEAWRAAINGLPPSERATRAAEASACSKALLELSEICSKKFDSGTPDLSALAGLLVGIERELSGTTGSIENTSNGGTNSTVDRGAAGNPSNATMAGIQSRQDVIRALDEVANFLRRTEPHSPVSHMLDRCIRWLGLGFNDLMEDLLKDKDAREAMREILGIVPPASKQ